MKNKGVARCGKTVSDRTKRLGFVFMKSVAVEPTWTGDTAKGLCSFKKCRQLLISLRSQNEFTPRLD